MEEFFDRRIESFLRALGWTERVICYTGYGTASSARVLGRVILVPRRARTGIGKATEEIIRRRGFRNFVGGRSASYEQEIQAAHSTAISEMSQRAQAMGANAVVGIRVDYFTAGSDNGMLAAIANGTAVII